MKKMPDMINQEDFSVIMKVMDSEMSAEESSCIFKAISLNKSAEISRTELLKYLQKHNIIISGLKLPKLGTSMEMTNTGKIIEDLAKLIDEKQINLDEMFGKLDLTKSDALGKQEFRSLIKSLDGEISDEDIPKIFTEFDMNEDGAISLSECKSKLCKISQVVNFQDMDLKESLKKIQAKKH